MSFARRLKRVRSTLGDWTDDDDEDRAPSGSPSPPAKSRSRSAPLQLETPSKGVFRKTTMSWRPQPAVCFHRKLMSSKLFEPLPPPSQTLTLEGDWPMLALGKETRQKFDTDLRARLAVLDAQPQYPSTQQFGDAVVQTLRAMGFIVSGKPGHKTPQVHGPPHQQKSWGITVSVMRMPERITVDPRDFSPEAVLSSELETLAEPDRRSNTFQEALAGNNNDFRRIVLVATTAANETDKTAERTTKEWLTTFMIKLDEQRLPDRRADRSEQIVVKCYPSTNDSRTLIIFRRCDNRRSENIAVTSSKEETHEDLFALAAMIRVGVAEGELTWEDVLQLKADWGDGRNRRISQGRSDIWSAKSIEEVGPEESPLKRVIWHNMASVSLPSNRNGSTFRHATVSELKAAFREICKTIVVDEALGTEALTCAITGQVLLTLPNRGLVAEMAKLVNRAKKFISIDHRWQISFTRDGNGVPSLSLSGPLNFSVTTWLWNTIKHRYGYSILALFIIGISNNQHLVAQTTGVVSTSGALLRSLVRIANVTRAIYVTHRVPCPLFDRFCLPLKRAKHAIETDLRILSLLGIYLAQAPPTPTDMINAIGMDEEEFAQVADEELLRMTKEYQSRTGLALDLDLVPPVRPGYNLDRAADHLMKSFVAASRAFDAELRQHFNLAFVQTGDQTESIISLTPTSRTTAEEVVQVFLRWKRDSFARVGFSGPNPELACYINSLCYVADHIIRKNGGPFAELTQVFFFDPVAPAIPLLVPPDSKGAFAPSIASNDHPRHQHGFASTEPNDLLFSHWDRNKNTVRLSSWISNCMDGQGPAEQIQRNRDEAALGAAFLAARPQSGVAAAFARFTDVRPGSDQYFIDLLQMVQTLDSARPHAPALDREDDLPASYTGAPVASTSGQRM